MAYSKTLKARIINTYLENPSLTYENLAEEYGIAAKTVKRWIREYHENVRLTQQVQTGFESETVDEMQKELVDLRIRLDEAERKTKEYQWKVTTLVNALTIVNQTKEGVEAYGKYNE